MKNTVPVDFTRSSRISSDPPPVTKDVKVSNDHTCNSIFSRPHSAAHLTHICIYYTSLLT
jgi:hypothetical protein